MQKNRLKRHYDMVIYHSSAISLSVTNVIQIPRISHIILNKSVANKVVIDRKQIFSNILYMELISNCRPCITKAKKSIDKFKLRQGMFVGCKVTLRKLKMHLFLDRLISYILPKMVPLNIGARASAGLPPRSPQAAYGIGDLGLYDEILRFGKGEIANENLGGFDMNFVYKPLRSRVWSQRDKHKVGFAGETFWLGL